MHILDRTTSARGVNRVYATPAGLYLMESIPDKTGEFLSGLPATQGMIRQSFHHLAQKKRISQMKMFGGPGAET
jgi:hypothetical protein